MNQQLEETLSKILDKSIELAEKTGEFVIEQGTELLQQFFMWHTAMHIFYIVLSFIFLIIAFTTPKLLGSKKELTTKDMEYGSISRNIKFLNRNYESGMPGIIFSVIICAGFSIASLAIFFIHIFYLINILIAPKLYLIEYFMK